MKVSELIIQLEKMPQHLEVMIEHNGYYVENEFEQIFLPFFVDSKEERLVIAKLDCNP